MVIKKIEIGGFGKLENYCLDLDAGVQVIYGPNESGKTTLMEFIKIIFYSRMGGDKSNSQDKNLRKKYSPWSGALMNGGIEFMLGGNLYRVQKEISKDSTLKDVTLLQNKSTGEIISLGKREEVGEFFFEIDIKSFERSTYVGNIGKTDFESGKNSKDTLADKMLLNLSDTGELDTSKSEIVKRLNSAVKDLEKSRGGGRIFGTELRVNELNSQIYELRLCAKEQEKITAELERIKKLMDEKNSLEDKMSKIKSWIKLQRVNKIIELVKKKEDFISEISKTGKNHSEWLETIKSFNKDISCIHSCEVKIKELKNLKIALSENIIPISEDELMDLNAKISQKDYYEKELSKAQYISKIPPAALISDCKLFDDISVLSFKSDLKGSLEKYKMIQLALKDMLNKKDFLINSSIRYAAFKTDDKNQVLEICSEEYKSKNKIYKALLILIFLIFLPVSFYFLLNNNILLALGGGLCSLISLAYAVSKLIKNKNALKNLNRDAQELKTICQSIDEMQYNLTQAHSEISELISSFINNLRSKLDECKNSVQKCLVEKRCSSVEDYRADYAKNKNLSKIYNSCRQSSDELSDLKNSLLANVKKYKNAGTYNDALDIIDYFNFRASEIENAEKALSIELNVLNINIKTPKDLESYSDDLKNKIGSEFNYDENEYKNSESRLNQLKSLNLEENYFTVRSQIKEVYNEEEVLRKELQINKTALEKMRKYLKSLKIAASAIEETADELRENFNPKLNYKSSKIFESLTCGKYKNLHIKKDYGFLISHGALERLGENFSAGTIDQAYLSLRIAAAELISKKDSMPLLLDDALMQYDDARLNAAFKFLNEYTLNKGGEGQIIIFTCHKHIIDCAQNHNVKVLPIRT